MDLDITKGRWKDESTGRLYKITELVPIQDTVLIWYIDLGTQEPHCMSVDIFLRKHEACGDYILENTS
jgi:hypothetical protein